MYSCTFMTKKESDHMNINPIIDQLPTQQVDTIIAYLYAVNELPGNIRALDKPLAGAISALIDLGDFKGMSGQVAVLYSRGEIPAKRVILVGLGDSEKFNLETIRRCSAIGILKAQELGAQKVVTQLPRYELEELSVEAISQAFVEGSLLALYNYAGQKSKVIGLKSPESLDIIVSKETLFAVQTGIQAGKAIASGTVEARELVNLPPNICDSIYIAEVASQIAENSGLEIEVLDEQQITDLKMGAFLAVARGSDTPPRFIILEYNANKQEKLDTIVLAGKGITFDTGGYNLKPSEKQGKMKADMAGAAAVIGAMKAIGQLKPPVHVVGLAPVVDNMISGRAYRQQEIITASNGVTIEIGNTDAEGRMLLADALVYAKRFDPVAVVDIATLTGSSVIALGRVASSLFSTDDELKEALLFAAAETGEKLWPMPLYPEYEKAIESMNADILNTGGKFGGVGSAAMFLKHFVSYPAWAHIDMAGMAMDAKDIPYVPEKGATGYGVRLLVEFVRRWA
jgi:leucyl aminopeptidase